ncbi:MAG: phosphate transport system regulatory protein PhoU [Gammaproteobacteria bacterium]|nr:MAG: phosphate transport system regulatory protein PhoU [Gammaproteobacteria bacterium]
MLDKHISSGFDEALSNTSSLFLRIGEMATNQVANAVHALIDVDAALAQKVIARDEEINTMERELDERIMQIVIKRQPTANDFRFVMAMSKGVVDLERIGDEAVKIAKMAQALTKEGEAPFGYSEVQHLSNQVRLMVHNALDAFRNFDAEKAFEVMRSDNVINREYQSASRALLTYIMEDSQHVSKVINILWVLRALERIGDHAKNISELVIYTSSGQDIKHTDYDEVEKAVQDANQKAAEQKNEANDDDNQQ